MEPRTKLEFDLFIDYLGSVDNTMILAVDPAASSMKITVSHPPGSAPIATLTLAEDSIFSWQNKMLDNLRKTWQEGGNEGDPPTVVLAQR